MTHLDTPADYDTHCDCGQRDDQECLCEEMAVQIRTTQLSLFGRPVILIETEYERDRFDAERHAGDHDREVA
jgi:hypothetical protein